MSYLTHAILFWTCLVQVVAYFMLYGLLLLLKIVPCETRTYIAEAFAFIYFNHQNLEILHMDFIFST